MKPGATTSPRASISRVGRGAGEPSDCRNAVAADGDIVREPLIASAVDNLTISNQQVVGRLLSTQCRLSEEP